MKKEKLAIAGPILSALAVLVALASLTMKAFQSIGIYTPTNPDALILALQISAAVFILGLAFFAIILPDKTRQILTGKTVRYGSNLLIITLAFLGILITLNYLAYKNPKEWDLTAEKSHTLAPESIAILAALPEKVEAIAFFSAYTPMDAADQLLLDFKANSNGKFDYQFVDPDLNPVEVREAGITGDGKILLQMREKQEIIPVASEQELLRGMLRLINPDERAVYFLTGHGEHDSEIQGERAVTRAIETLYGKNYIVQPLNLLAENAIPDDALTIVIVGATNPLSADEIALFDSYLADGGGLVALVDPTPLSELGNEEDTLVAYLAESWGVLLDDNLIVDPSSNPPSDAVAYSYAEHPITQKMNNVAAYFPFARSMQFVENKNLTQTLLAWTIDRAWGESNFSALEVDGDPVAFDEEDDIPGPLAMASSVENISTGGRIVVFGNAVFAGDEAFDAYGNGDLFINAIDWAAEQEDLLNLTPKPQVERTFLAPNDFQLITILLGTICLLPGMMIVGGFLAWMNRKKRG